MYLYLRVLLSCTDIIMYRYHVLMPSCADIQVNKVQWLTFVTLSLVTNRAGVTLVTKRAGVTLVTKHADVTLETKRADVTLETKRAATWPLYGCKRL